MSGAIAGIGLRAIAGAALGKVGSAGGSALKWLGSLDLVHMLLLVLALFGAWQTVGRWVQHRHTVKVEGQLYAATVQLTAMRKDLATSQANETALKKAIADQNAAIADLGSKSATQQQLSARALQTAAQRATEAQATSDRIKRSSRSAPLKSAPACEPSDILKGQWK